MPLNQPSEDPVEYAEQALLGAFLHSPGHLPAIAQRLRTPDWSLPPHRALYQAMNEHPLPNRPLTGAEHYDWHLTVTTAANQQTRTFAPAYASTLMACCPNPDNAPAYARIVLAGSIRRTIARSAHRLAQAARIDTARNLQPDNTLTAAKELADAVRQTTARWGSTAPGPGALPDPARPAPSPSSQTLDEQGLLAALASSPDTIGRTARWLSPGVFCHDRHKILYECMTALHHRSEPIDPVTLTWEARHRGALLHHRLTPQDIRHLLTPRTGDSTYWVDRLLQSNLVYTAATAATGVRHAAEREAACPEVLIAAAHTAIAQITEAHQRWQGHLQSTAEARAGPPGPVVHYGRAVKPPGIPAPAVAAPAPDRRPR